MALPLLYGVQHQRWLNFNDENHMGDTAIISRTPVAKPAALHFAPRRPILYVTERVLSAT